MWKKISTNALQSVGLAVFIVLHFFLTEGNMAISLYFLLAIPVFFSFLLAMGKAFLPKPSLYGILSNGLISSIIGIAYLSFNLPDDAKWPLIAMMLGLANLFFFYTYIRLDEKYPIINHLLCMFLLALIVF